MKNKKNKNLSLEGKINQFLLGLILLIGFFLRFYRLPQTAAFVGDQGRDYLVAKEILTKGFLPLVGPQTSIPWVHLGPLFYYFLAFFLWLGKFDPIWPAYGTAIFGVTAIYLIFKLGKLISSEKEGLLAAFFYAISPYAVIQARISLHPSIYPVFVILFLISLVKIAEANKDIKFWLSFLVISFLIAIQLHLSAILLILIGIIFWEKNRLKSLRFLGAFIAGAAIITFYKIIKNSPFTSIFYWWKILGEIFAYDNSLSTFLALGILMIGVIEAVRKKQNLILTSFLVIVPGLTIKNSQAEHYFNLFLPVVILGFSLGLSRLWNLNVGRFLVCFISAYFLLTNLNFLIESNYFSQIYGPGLPSRIRLTEFIVEDAGRNQFSLKRCGPLWDYPSTNQNYEYLAWWLKSKKGIPEKGSGSNQFIYYIFEPPSAWITKEGCDPEETVGKQKEVFKFDLAIVEKMKEGSN